MFERIRNFFRKAGAGMGVVQSLQKVTDHPKINVNQAEYERIADDFRRFRGEWDDVVYLNSERNWQKRPYVALNMDKVVAETLSSIVFNEECQINIADEKANEFIQEVLQRNDFNKNFSRYLEPMFATGGLALRPYVNSATKKIELAWALASTFYPLENNTNDISECAIATTTTKSEGKQTVYYTLLEFHEWSPDEKQYIITNELYRSESSNIVGVRVPLKTIFPEMEETTTLEKLTQPQVSYLKPAGFNNIDPYSPLGLGFCDNATTTIKQINDTYDQFNWEIIMGQRRVIVSDHFLDVSENELEKGNVKPTFEPNVNIYQGLSADIDNMQVIDVTSDIRAEQYISSINQFFKTLEMQTKLSVGTFSFDGKSVKTATEVVSENSLTFRTRNSQITEVTDFIQSVVISILELASFMGLYEGKIQKKEDIEIGFDDGVFTDKNDQLEYYGKAATFGFIPTAEAIQRVFKVPKKTAEEWLVSIQQEQLGIDPFAKQQNAEKSMLDEQE
ncbi:phage portal protein [Listeria ivanovii]|uniref:phage portal protein n=1 Tax=Listeria ivanovii TaxID=1638 RepID=UPI0019403A47|nr:phage portal protein [Listeria ivanovii]